MTRFERLFGSKKAILRVYPPPPPPAAGAMAGASFIRTDYFVDPMERPEHGGPMRIDPEGLLRYRRSLDADSILILADVQGKNAGTWLAGAGGAIGGTSLKRGDGIDPEKVRELLREVAR